MNATITIHGMTRSKELVDSFYKLDFRISYLNVVLLHDVWIMHDLHRCSVYLDEIAWKVSSISFIDNDEFSYDTLTGWGIAHRTNWMFLHYIEHRSIEVLSNICDIP